MSTRLAIIGGTGFETALEEHLGRSLGSRQISTDYGTADVTLFEAGTAEQLVFLPRHGAGHSVVPHRINHRANIAALRSLGIGAILSTSAVGSLRQGYDPGEIAVPDDFIDLRGGAPTTFFEHAPVVHTDFSEPFSARLRAALMQQGEMAASNLGLPERIIHSCGTYLCLNGPRYETPAEVRCFAAWGADIVGMTVAPEAILAREAGIEYASVSVVTNYGTGLSNSALSHGEVEQMMRERRPLVIEMLLGTCRSL